MREGPRLTRMGGDGRCGGMCFCEIGSWRREASASTRTGLRGMTGSAFEAMDVVVGKKMRNREEVWRREGQRLTLAGLREMTGSAFKRWTL